MFITRVVFVLFFITSTIVNAMTPEERLTKMSLEQKIGQLIMPAVPCNPDNPTAADRLFTLKLPTNLHKEYAQEMIQKYHVGGFLYACEGEIPDQVALTNNLQALSEEPLLIAQDFEPGLVRLFDAIEFPRNMTLGATHNEALIEKIGVYIGEQAYRLGVHIIFAPVVDTNSCPANPIINDRSFGENPAAVARLGTAFMRGVMSQGRVPCAKHFPGHGDTETDSHLGLPVITHERPRLEQVELVPFQALIDAGVPMVMPAHMLVPCLDQETPTSLSHSVITRELKEKMGFKGIVITDALIMRAITQYAQEKGWQLGQEVVEALKAGNDIILFPADVAVAFDCIKRAVVTGELTEQDLDQRVLKILQLKETLGLYSSEQGSNNRKSDDRRSRVAGVVRDVVTDAGRALKRQAYEEAIVLVKNDEAVLPLKSNEPALVVRIGGQPAQPFVQTLQQGGLIRAVWLPVQPTQAQVDRLRLAVSRYAKVIVGFFEMNRARAANYGISDEARATVTALSSMGKQVVVVLFGNPYAGGLFGEEQALIIAHSQDPDAQQAAAQVILGSINPQGRLPVSLVALLSLQEAAQLASKEAQSAKTQHRTAVIKFRAGTGLSYES